MMESQNLLHLRMMESPMVDLQVTDLQVMDLQVTDLQVMDLQVMDLQVMDLQVMDRDKNAGLRSLRCSLFSRPYCSAIDDYIQGSLNV